jgi:hypothetical protein
MSSAVNAQLRVHRLFPATTVRRLLAPFSRIARPAWRVTDRATALGGPMAGRAACPQLSVGQGPAGRPNDDPGLGASVIPS